VTRTLIVAAKGGRDTPSSRYRVHNLVPELRRLGWEVRTLTPSVDRSRRVPGAMRDLALAARGCDVLLVQRPGRRCEELPILRIASSRARVVAIDVDDPMHETGASGWAVRRAQVAIVGSHALADHYAGRIPMVEIVPTALPVDAYIPRERPPGRRVVGWIGDGPAYADPLVRMIVGVASAANGWTIRVVGTRGDEVLERRLRAAAGTSPLELIASIAWQDEHAIAAEVASFDVGLAPFRDAEGASFKTVQYLAAGVVPLAEAGGEAGRHAQAALGGDAAIVKPGVAEEVAAALARLADDSTRAALASRCRDAAARLYSHEAAARRVDRVLRAALARRPR
jgi:glycosyltransferase involved in cell wall biosynthesis